MKTNFLTIVTCGIVKFDLPICGLGGKEKTVSS